MKPLGGTRGTRPGPQEQEYIMGRIRLAGGACSRIARSSPTFGTSTRCPRALAMNLYAASRRSKIRSAAMAARCCATRSAQVQARPKKRLQQIVAR
eukprot:3678402-Pyramimonas_sp.AAC.1